MTKTICTCLSLQSGFLYQLKWHSQSEYSYYIATEVLKVVFGFYSALTKWLTSYKQTLNCNYIRE